MREPYELSELVDGYLNIFDNLIEFIHDDPILSIILAYLFIRLLKGFYERLRRIF